MTKTSRVLEHLGVTAADMDRMLQEFTDSAQLFSSGNPQLIDKYENKWIGVFKGRVEAVANTLQEVEEKIARKHIPVHDSIIRHIDRNEKTLIL